MEAEDRKAEAERRLIGFNPIAFITKLMELKAEQDGYPDAVVTVKEIDTKKSQESA